MDYSTQPAASVDAASKRSSARLPSHTGLCDGLGMIASLACVVHCAAMPWLVGLLPAVGLTWLADGTVHRWLLAVCFVLAFCAFLPGYFQHRRPAAALLGAGGIALLAWAVSIESSDRCRLCEPNDGSLAPWLTPLGGLLLVAGHLTNQYFCRAQSSCHRRARAAAHRTPNL